jgi:hypothetical protein
MFAGSFFTKQPGWFLWIIRCFSAVWLIVAAIISNFRSARIKN